MCQHSANTKLLFVEIFIAEEVFLCTCYHNITQYKSTKYLHMCML